MTEQGKRDDVAALSEEDRKRIDSYIRSHPDGGDFEMYVRLKDLAERVTEYERKDKAVLRAAYDELEKQWRDVNHKQAELIAENAKLKDAISYQGMERLICYQSELEIRVAAQAAELDKLRTERDELKEYFNLSERAKQVLRDKGYGWTGLDILKTCELVPGGSLL